MHPLSSIVVLALASPPAETDASSGGFRFFPAEPPPLKTKLAEAHVLGTECLAHDPLLEDPISTEAQSIKSALSTLGLEYQINQSLTLVLVDEPEDGRSSTLGAYSFQAYLNWYLARDEAGGAWLSVEAIGGNGIGSNWLNRSPGSAIESLSEPGGTWTGTNLAVVELAGALSLADGEIAVIAGMVNQSNYIDLNTYSQSQFGQLLNYAFSTNLAMPLPFNDLGVGVQWQPVEWGYVNLGFGSNNGRVGTAPWRDLSSDDLSLIAEFGLVVDDLVGLGPGVYRLQPFVATIEGESGGGIGVNLEQQLGAESPFGVFGRFGWADDVAATYNDVRAQAAFGVAGWNPFGGGEGASRGLFGRARQSDYLGVAFAWLRDAAGDRDEYALEATYALQVTPTISLQPDVQWIIRRGEGDDRGSDVLFQLQMNVVW